MAHLGSVRPPVVAKSVPPSRSPDPVGFVFLPSNRMKKIISKPRPPTVQGHHSGVSPHIGQARSVAPKKMSEPLSDMKLESAASPPRPSQTSFRLSSQPAPPHTHTDPPTRMQMHAQAPPEPTLGRPLSGRVEVENAVIRHMREGLWRLPTFESNEDRRLFQRIKAVRTLLQALPAEVSVLICGPEAEAQVPDPEARMRLACTLIEAQAGPEGEQAKKGLRAWLILSAHARECHLPSNGLPAGQALVGHLVDLEARRARAKAKGSRGGQTVGATIAEGFRFLADPCGLPINANTKLVSAMAAPTALAPSSRRHAGSLPLGVQCQLEHIAAQPEDGVSRSVARSFLLTSFAHHIRMNDALNASIWLEDDVIVGRTSVRSKDGIPLEVFAPAEGWLGPFNWAEEHLASMPSSRHVWPDFSASRGKYGQLAHATGQRDGVMPRTKALLALKHLCSVPPLRMTAAEFDACGISLHSPHGTGSDMIRFMGASCAFTDFGENVSFNEHDARAIGHWLRD